MTPGAARGSLAALALLAALAPGCECNRDRTGPPPPASGSLAPVPVPAGLLGELVLAHPARSWTDVRTTAAGTTVLLPRSVGGLTAQLLGLSIIVADEIDERLPLWAVSATDPAGGPLEVVAALHVKDGPRLVAVLTAGADARFTQRREPTSGAILLDRRKGDPSGWLAAPVVAVLANHLLGASSEAAVARLGPYLVRTLAQRPVPPTDLTITIAAGTLGEPTARWLRPVLASVARSDAAERLRPVVDLAEASSLLLGALSELGAGRVTLALTADEIQIDAALTARDGNVRKRLGELPTVDPRQLAELPDDTLLAGAWIETREGRQRRAAARAGTLAALLAAGGQPFDSAGLARQLGAIARARGDRTQAGVRCTGVGLTGFARGDASDETALREALVGLTELGREPAVAARLDALAVELGTRKGKIERIPHDVFLVRLVGNRAGREPIDLRYLVGDGRFFVAAGMETIETLQQLYQPAAERSLGARPAWAGTIAALGGRSWLTLLTDPQGVAACRAGAPGGPLVTPLALAIGPNGDGVTLRLRAAKVLLKVLARDVQ